jgi:hypothetical protein
MIPVYFPLTFVSETTAARIVRWCDQIGLLAPSADSKDASPILDRYPGIWRLYCPQAGDEAMLALLETEWRRWADMHAGADLAAVMAAREADGPFVAPPAINSLRSRIRAGNETGSTAAVDPLMAARVFLRFAHGLDRDQTALKDQLCHIAGLERQMRRELEGVAEEPAAEMAIADDPGAFLTERRLSAWARLALSLDVETEVFVTDSAAVIAVVAEYFGPLNLVRRLPEGESPPESPETQQLSRAITEALMPGTHSAPAAPAALSAATIYAIDRRPADFLHRLVAGRRMPPPEPRGTGRCLVIEIDDGIPPVLP